MALKKVIKQSDGITTEYHRIINMIMNINQSISISVNSYVDEESRDIERDPVSGYPYNQNITFTTDYVENMTIEDAYEYLKTLEMFEGAEDV